MTKLLIKKVLKSFDYFGVQFNFHYKSREKYHSATGGVIFLGFVILTITYISINMVSFLQRENFSIIYYTTRLSKTDEISFFNYSTNYAFGLTCGSISDPETIEKMFKVSINHITRATHGGVTKKTSKQMTIRHCEYGDFFNEFNETFDDIGFSNLYCINETDSSVQGIYSDDIFKYFEISISSNEDTKENYDLLNEVLQNNECDFNIYFVDVAVDLYDYKNPIKRFMNTNFLALKADEYIKMNLDFLTQKFDSYENYLFDTHSSKYYIGFDTFERYSIYKGTNRFEEKPYDYNMYSKIYLRSALQRNIIQRKYMKLTEFAADMSSILSQILLFLFVSVSFINRFYSNQSVMKKIFQFKDGKNKNNFKIKNEFKKHWENFDILHPYDNSENQTNDFLLKETSKGISLHTNYTVNTNNKGKDHTPRCEELQESNVKRIQIISSSTRGCHYSLKSKNLPRMSIIKKQLAPTRRLTILKKGPITLKYSIIELLFVFICPCCAWEKLRLKNILLAKARKKLYYQMDILTYLKNMQLLELLNYILLNSQETAILKVLAKPSISLVNRIDIYEQIHQRCNVDLNEEEMKEFISSMKYLYDKKNKTPQEERLYKIASIELQNLLVKE